MKLMHLSDLHLGKRVNEFSMIEDQEYILNEILKITDIENPDCILIAGDVYDKNVPSAEAVSLFDEFLSSLQERKKHVFVISGNHDSAERIAFGARIMENSGIHMSPVYNGSIVPVKLYDEYGEVLIFMLPFIKPVNVRLAFEEEAATYTDALKIAISHMNIGKGRNVLVAHQLVTGALRCDSEDISIGGMENVDKSVFEVFDYIALGHIHRPQNITKNKVRYCGTPLKYSFSEAAHEKSVTIVELKEKGCTNVYTVPLRPIRDMREIKGSYDEITDRRKYGKTNTEDYIHITLTDEENIPDAAGKLRSIYPNLMKLDYDNERTRTNNFAHNSDAPERKNPIDMFDELYKKQNNMSMSSLQRSFTEALIEEID